MGYIQLIFLVQSVDLVVQNLQILSIMLRGLVTIQGHHLFLIALMVGLLMFALLLTWLVAWKLLVVIFDRSNEATDLMADTV